MRFFWHNLYISKAELAEKYKWNWNSEIFLQWNMNFFPESSRPSIFWISRSSHPEGFLGKGVLKICSKFAREHPCLNVVSIKLLSNFANIIAAMSYMKWNFFIIFQKLLGITFKTSKKTNRSLLFMCLWYIFCGKSNQNDLVDLVFLN